MKSTIAETCRSIGLLLLAAAVAACGVDGQDPPSFIGPSGFAQSVTLSASPDRLARDGSSQSVVTITVRNESGQPVSGQRVTVGSSGGALSQAEVTTGSDGRASVVVTAPPAGSVGNTIDVFATPVTANGADAVTRTLQIALLGTSNTTAPTAAFTATPTAPGLNELVTFDASGSTDEGTACGNTCTFTWTFPNGVTKTGRIVTHTFTSVGSQMVTLSVRDAAGTTASTQQVIAVSSIAAPTASITVLPTPPQVGQQATFTASATPAAGRSIVSYNWNFGDGTTRTTTSPAVTHTFTSEGQFVVTVTATDDLGNSGSSSLQVTPSLGAAPTATFTTSPASPGQFEPVTFNASASRPGVPGRTLTYHWNFGDGTTGTGATTTHAYSVLGTYTTTLTVTDSAGLASTTTGTVTVASGVTAAFNTSPTNPRVVDNIVFDAEQSRGSSNGFGGRNPIVQYIWDFGDHNDPGLVTTTDRIVQHRYTDARTYTINLTVVDSAGRRATVAQTLTVAP